MSKDNIIKFYPKNAAENPDNVLEQAIGEFDSVVIMGMNKDGEFESRGSLNVSLAEANLYADNLKYSLLGSFSFTEEDYE